jgi:hypothetical protein
VFHLVAIAGESKFCAHYVVTNAGEKLTSAARRDVKKPGLACAG